MARKDTAKTQQEAAVDEMARDTGTPALADGHDQIVEEAPSIGAAAKMSAPMGDPGDLSAFGQSTMLPNDLGVGDDSGFGGPVDPGADLGSTLLDDLAGDLSDPSDGFDGMSDSSGQPELDDQSGWTRSGDTTDPFDTSEADDPPPGVGWFDLMTDSAAHGDAATAVNAFVEGVNEVTESWVAMADSDDLANSMLEDLQEGGPPDDDDDEEHESQYGDGEGSNDPPGSQTMPAPDDGTGGDPDASDFIGGRGDVDPAPETEDHGGGELIGGRGDVDPAPDTEDHGGEGGLDMITLGLGAVDPLDGESTLLGGDTGDLAEMADEADLGDVEVEIDDSLVDADIGEDV